MRAFQIRPLNENDRDWMTSLLKKYWDSTIVVTRGRIKNAIELPGFLAVQDNKPIGLVTYRIEDNECEIVTLNSLAEGIGFGSALIDAVKDIATTANYKKLWLITTNDNVKALRFYQKRGFRLANIYPNAIEHSRRLKPEIPLVGNDGIPIRDEIELEVILCKETLK